MAERTSWTIREVDGKDPDSATLISDLHMECFGYRGGDITNTGHWWVAFGPNKAPGAFGGLWPSVRLPETGYLARGGVAPFARGQGLQRRLIRKREAKARKLGWLTCITDTVEGNIHSANNLIACGYRLYEPPVRYASAGSCYWKRHLHPGLA